MSATFGVQFAAESEQFTVPIAAVFAPHLECSVLQNSNILLYRLLKYFCANSGVQFAAESEQFTVQIAAVFAPRLECSLLQNSNSLLCRLLQC